MQRQASLGSPFRGLRWFSSLYSRILEAQSSWRGHWRRIELLPQTQEARRQMLPVSCPIPPQPCPQDLITSPPIGAWAAAPRKPQFHWLWQNRHCTGSWERKGRREKNFGLAAPNQSCNLYDRGAQTLYPPSPSSPAFPPQRGNLESTLCKVWVCSATAEFWQLPFANVFVRSNIQNQVGKRPRGNCVAGGGA